MHDIGIGGGIVKVHHDKTVRDRIPRIIEDDGRECSCESVNDETFLPYLESKLQEELDEYLESRELEELADLVDVIERIVALRGEKTESFSAIRDAKIRRCGAFDRNFLLDSVDDPR